MQTAQRGSRAGQREPWRVRASRHERSGCIVVIETCECARTRGMARAAECARCDRRSHRWRRPTRRCGDLRGRVQERGNHARNAQWYNHTARQHSHPHAAFLKSLVEAAMRVCQSEVPRAARAAAPCACPHRARRTAVVSDDEKTPPEESGRIPPHELEYAESVDGLVVGVKCVHRRDHREVTEEVPERPRGTLLQARGGDRRAQLREGERHMRLGDACRMFDCWRMLCERDGGGAHRAGVRQWSCVRARSMRVLDARVCLVCASCAARCTLPRRCVRARCLRVDPGRGVEFNSSSPLKTSPSARRRTHVNTGMTPVRELMGTTQITE
jgi:hypothetical protein